MNFAFQIQLGKHFHIKENVEIIGPILPTFLEKIILIIFKRIDIIKKVLQNTSET